MKVRLVSALFAFILQGHLLCKVSGQVFDAGPSDSSLFSEVVDLPVTQTTIGGDFGGSIEQSIQLNIFEGGAVEANARSFEGAEVNLLGGLLERDFTARAGSEVNVIGGTVADDFHAALGSRVDIRGGNLGSNVFIQRESLTTIFGGDFRFNNAVFENTSVSVERFGEVFGGTLEDGSVFIFSPFLSDVLQGVRLQTPGTGLPAIDTTPRVLASPAPVGPSGLREGQQLTVVDGGVLGANFAIVGGRLNVEGGLVGERVQVLDGQVDISGGEVGGRLAAFDGSQINISGGTVGGFSGFHAGSEINLSGGVLGGQLDATTGSVVNVTGGTLGGIVDALDGSIFNISGGTVGLSFAARAGSEINVMGGEFVTRFTAFEGSRVNISGGRTGLGFNANSGSDVIINGGVLGGQFDALPNSGVEIMGGDYRLDGVRIGEQQVTLQPGQVLSGVLEDGSAFIFSGLVGDRIFDVELLEVALPMANVDPIIVSEPLVAEPSGLRVGQSLIVREGGSIGDDFALVGGQLTVAGGTVGERLEVAGATLEVRSGEVGEGVFVFQGADVSVRGGELGGSVGVFSGGRIEISGGDIGDSFIATVDSEVGLVGINFQLDGVPIDGLLRGTATTLVERDVTLTGTLLDGNAIEIELNSTFGSGSRDFVDPNATLTLTLLESLSGDYNSDGFVSAADYTVWRDNLGQALALPGETVTPGEVTIEDYQVFVDSFGSRAVNTSPANALIVPEPAASFLLCGLASLALISRWYLLRDVAARRGV